MSPSRAFWIGAATAIAIVVFVAFWVWFFRRGEYLCSTWGRRGELVSCRVPKSGWGPFGD